MKTPHSPHAAKLGDCKTSAEYHRLLVISRIKGAPKSGRQMDYKSGVTRKGVPQ